MIALRQIFAERPPQVIYGLRVTASWMYFDETMGLRID